MGGTVFLETRVVKNGGVRGGVIKYLYPLYLERKGAKYRMA